ncbi:TatD family hydrolase [Fonticella tunisiensis]|uniref:TatD DNase family protein n=1 Tax=Fonticella tunisiensis TaxID=1096341 RepID=A0A4R7K970_9CLOT|nr:TatD family hydrolase [Fonticella tunisiensis]TDT50557.1 TatD DNase family protein [Fonticella tunisiensis]
MIFDSHAHYDDEAFKDDREEVIDKIRRAGVEKVLNCGASLEGCYKTLELTEKYDFIYGAVGIHPEYPEAALENINKIGELLENKKIVAVGEIGLDYYYEPYDRELQLRAFREQMDLARSLDMPVVIHDREAHEDTLKVIKEFKGVRGVLHCYSGSPEFAKEVLKHDYYFGFTGVVTFKNAKKAVDTVSVLPIDRILVETDCPYMAPVPYRGKRNDSSYLVHIINRIAEIRGMDYETIKRITYENACQLFNIEK